MDHVLWLVRRGGDETPRNYYRAWGNVLVSTTCALCRRVIPDERIPDPQVIQEHHLRPEERATSPTVFLCRPCHDQIHAVFTNEELRGKFDTVDALRSADRLDGYLNWIRGTDKIRIDVKTSDHVRHQS